MQRAWGNIPERDDEAEALAQRLEIKLHAVAMILTAIVLAMRLVAGHRDLVISESAWLDAAETSTPDSAAVFLP